MIFYKVYVNTNISIFSAPSNFVTISLQLADSVNSAQQLEKLIELLDDIEAAEILTNQSIVTIIAQANTQKAWIEAKAEQIYSYFGLIAPTEVLNEATTEEPTEAPTTDSPNLGSNSVIASFTIVAACTVVKMLI